MGAREWLSSLRFLRREGEPEQTRDGWAEIRCGGRKWEDFYRRRWQYDKKVRSTHGINCTGSCSWDVYVKDGIVVWETQNVDYPRSGPDTPSYEPRGCPRGATSSWYTYSPVRVKYPYIRSALLELWREALRASGDPVAAWSSIVSDPAKSAQYKQARGKGGLVRAGWDEAATLVAASLVHTIQEHGPDRIFGFSPIPAKSMVCYASGSRFLSLIGGVLVSFYDWYCDLPPASPQIWGEQTDVPESADWYNASYMIVWGSNLPQTRSPDAHFYAEARYRGARVAAVSPDYAEYVRFADRWLPARAGTDGALAMAMAHVIMKEFHLDRQVGYFNDYAKRFTDLPFLVSLDRDGHRVLPSSFLRASDLGVPGQGAAWMPVVLDGTTGRPVAPNGTIGQRWDSSGRWNLRLEDSQSGQAIAPLLTLAEDNDGWELASFPVFVPTAGGGPAVRQGAVPVKHIQTPDGVRMVTTVFDLMAANLGIDRGHGGDCAKGYQDMAPYTPAWQEAITGVPAADAVLVAREFAANAEKTKGRSLIFLGSGVNHWYHADSTYRAIIGLVLLCGCQGVNGGGWAHYVGQEKVRPLAGWSTLAFARDWTEGTRQFNGTSCFYFASDQWRYDNIDPRRIASPLYPDRAPAHIADANVEAVRRGWLPFYPQFHENPLGVCAEAGAASREETEAAIRERLQRGDLKLAVEDPSAPENHPRVLLVWRSNLLGSSSKGHEYFLRHLLGADDAVLGPEAARQPETMTSRPADNAGKLDLLVVSEMRMTTTTLYADVVLPAAGWYEMHDLNTTDLHPFVNPFNPAVDPPWEARTNWDQFKILAREFSRLAQDRLGKHRDAVMTPLQHDTPGEADGADGPRVQVVERDYPNVYRMFTALGPQVAEAGVGAKGVFWNADEEYQELGERLGRVQVDGTGRPDLTEARQAAEAILTLSPETNGRVAVKAWRSLEGRTGLSLAHLALDRMGESIDFASITARPRKVISSPTWSGLESESRTYSPFTSNIEEGIPFRTLTGRSHFYLDHDWMRLYGDELPTYRPPLGPADLGSLDIPGLGERGGRELVLGFLTPHSKWSINSMFADTQIMLTLFRGGPAVWLSREDAEALGVDDSDWIECFNANGAIIARAVVSHRIPPGKAFMYHAQERTVNVPLSPLTGKRGGGHNSVTRILMKPTHMIGGYAQLSFSANYYGPVGAQRDEVIVVRKAGEVRWDED